MAVELDRQDHQDLLIALARIEIKQEQLLEKIMAMDSVHATLSQRMTEMETKINYAAGALAVAGFLFFLGLDWVKAKIGFNS